MRRTTQLTISLLAFQLFSLSSFGQGSLTPPGAPGPTMKTLDQVEARIPIDAAHTPGSGNDVFTISVAGSYYLTGNVVVTDKTKNAIHVTAGNVTVDLNGFQLVGAADMSDTAGGSGVLVDQVQGIVLKNGRISKFINGVSIGNQDGTPLSATVLGITATNCSATGIAVRGSNALVKDSVATSNGQGIEVGVAGAVVHCVASENTNDGIDTNDWSLVTGCTAQNNGAKTVGAAGIGVANGVAITHCVASGNAIGIRTRASAQVSNCTTHFNQRDGIQTGQNSLVSNCTAAGSFTGIEVGANSTVSNCTASNNATSNFGSGIQSASSDATVAHVLVVHCTSSGNTYGMTLGRGCTVTDCDISRSGFQGLNVDVGSTVRHCNVRLNREAGIFLTSDCYIADNTVDSNNQSNESAVDFRVAGIWAFGSSNRIEGNSITSNVNCPGLKVEGANNLILHNSARANTPNYSLATNNRYGPIVDLTSNPNFGPVSGNFAGSTLNDSQGGSHPWANYAY